MLAHARLAAFAIQYWVNRFERDGLAGMAEGERPGRPRALGERELAEINRVLRQTPKAAGLGENLWDGKSLSAFIEKQFHVELGVRQCQRLFRQMGFRLRKPRPLIACRSTVTETAQKKLKRLVQDWGIDLWAEDEVHFQQHGSRCRMWIAPETRLWCSTSLPERGYFGAVRLRDGKFTYHREDQKFNAETFLVFLKQLKHTACRSRRRVVVILDNARYHHGKLHKDWRALHCEQFQLDYLPPYSPELNPIERVWKLTRRKCLHNVHFEELSEVTDASKANSLSGKTNQILRQLCAIT